MEIEKKYLVKKLPVNLNSYKFIDMEQSYLSFEPVLRIRKENEKYYLTCKGEGLLSRDEFNLEITKEVYLSLIKDAQGNKIKKIRHLIPENKYTYELDIYEEIKNHKNLVTVEVEFKTREESECFIPPDWFGEDITFKNEYKNNNLARSQ
ncbi:MAG: adenylate cyclase [Lachnospirales bacterium]